MAGVKEMVAAMVVAAMAEVASTIIKVQFDMKE